MPNTNTTSASVDPDPLIGEAVADTPGAALARAAFMAILDGRLPLLSDLTRANAASSEDIEALIGRSLMVDDDARYEWLRAMPAVLEGEFDATSGSARYHAYVGSGRA
jgi:hypothetical protein